MNKTYQSKGIKVFAGSSNRPLAGKIAQAMGVPLSDMVTGQFSDGESFVRVNESVRGYDVYIIQSTSEPVNDNLMELLIVIDAMRRASAGRITAVIPYFGYARQDRKYSAREPISVKLVANLLERAGIDHIITMDLHSVQIQGFFKKPLINMKGMPLFVDYYRRKMRETEGDFVVVAPGIGSVKRNRQLAEELDVPLAIIDSRIAKVGDGLDHVVIGEVEGKNIITTVDIIDTGNTIYNAIHMLRAAKVKKIFVAGIHPILAGDCGDMLRSIDMDEVMILDTISHEKTNDYKSEGGNISPQDGQTDDNTKGFVKLSVCDIFANAIISIHKNRSVSRLYNELYDVEK